MNTTSPGPDRPPQQPWLQDLQVAVDGNSTVLSTADGRMGAPGTGWFVDDRRVLSGLDVLVDQRCPSSVAAASRGSVSEFWGAARGLGDPGADPTVEVRRVRRTHGVRAPEGTSCLSERITITSRASRVVRAGVQVCLTPCSDDLAAVKMGRPGAQQPELLGGAGGWVDARHRSTVTVVGSNGDPWDVSGADGELRSDHQVVLEPGASVTIQVTIHTERLVATSFDSGSGSAECDFGLVRVEADDARVGPLVRASLDDLTGLLQTDPEDPRDLFAAAGTPWYLTLFGRDSAWTARMMAPFSPRLSMGTLRALARRQGREDHIDRAEQPGKILHEVRRSTPRGGELSLPSTYYGSIDATALWILLMHDAWRWGAPEDAFIGLAPNLSAALAWLRRSVADSPDGLLRYADETGSGLSNQGWKDSSDSMRCRDGSIAPAPIALVEAQSYAVQAARAAADLARRAAFLTGAGIDPDDWETWADDLAARVHERFWVDRADGRYLAMALDADGRQVDGIGSNMGHVLAGDLLDARQAEDVMATLSGPDMLGPFGIGTLSRKNPAYNPIGYHTGSVWTHDTAIILLGLGERGFGEAASVVAQALVRSGASFGGRWPELCGGESLVDDPIPYPAACRPQAWASAASSAMLTALLGLEADVPNGILRVAPLRQQPFGHLRVKGVRVADAQVDIDVEPDGSVKVTGLPPSITLLTDADG